MRIRIILAGTCLACLLSGCVKEPEGPAEQIGRGIDQIAQGLDQYDKDTAGRSSYDTERDEFARRRAEQERLRRQSDSSYKYDPYWDDVPAPEKEFDDRGY